MSYSYEGETRKMDNGLNATIIKFRDFYDIDVMLENQHVSEHQQYMDFVNGDTTALGFGKRKCTNKAPKSKKRASQLEPAILYDYLYVGGNAKEYGKRRD